MTLEEYLEKYKEVTLKLIENIKTTGNIRYLVEERDEILYSIKNLNYDEKEIETIEEKLNLCQLEKEMNVIFQNEIEITKNKIRDLKRMENGNNAYMSMGYVQSRFNRFS